MVQPTAGEPAVGGLAVESCVGLSDSDSLPLKCVGTRNLQTLALNMFLSWFWMMALLLPGFCTLSGFLMLALLSSVALA